MVPGTVRWIGIAFLIAVGIGLGRPSLWIDEALAHEIAAHGWRSLMAAILEGKDSGGCVHATIMGLIVDVLGLGRSEAMLRLPSLLAGAVTVLGLGALGRRGLKSGGTAAALLAAFHMTVVQDARQARVYALWLALATVYLAGVTLDEIARGRLRRIGTILAGVALVLCHAFGVATLVGVVVFDVARRERGGRRAALLRAEVIVPFVVALLWHIVRLRNAGADLNSFWASAPLWRRLEDLAQAFLGGWRVFGLPSVAIGGALCACGVLAIVRSERRVLAAATLGVLPVLAAPVILTLLAPRGIDLLLPRYFTPLLIPVILLGARAVTTLPRTLRPLVLFALFLGWATVMVQNYRLGSPSGPAPREAVRWLNARARSNDLTIVYPWPEIVTVSYYGVQGELCPLRDAALAASRVESVRRAGGRVWIALMRPPGDLTPPPLELTPVAPFEAFGTILVGEMR